MLPNSICAKLVRPCVPMTIRSALCSSAALHTGEMILNDIFPHVLHFTGPTDLLQVLQTAETTEAPVMVEGRLYLSDRMLAVTAAKEGAANTG